MPKHIGIVAVSPEGSALCYRQIFRIANRLIGDHGHPRVSLHNEPFEEYVAAVFREDWHSVGRLLRRSAAMLSQMGAEFCITPDNLMQHAVHLAEVGSPVPWLTMSELVADAVVRDRRRKVGLVGTKMVMFGSTYQTVLGLKGVHVEVPGRDDAEAFDDIIFQELVYGVVRRGSRERARRIIGSLGDAGCEGVILGFTEGSLLIDEGDTPVPVYDSMTLLAEGAARRALGLERR